MSAVIVAPAQVVTPIAPAAQVVSVVQPINIPRLRERIAIAERALEVERSRWSHLAGAIDNDEAPVVRAAFTRYQTARDYAMGLRSQLEVALA